MTAASATYPTPIESIADSLRCVSAGSSLSVLTLTPFYPSHEEPTQGCFIAEPLSELKQHNVQTRVFAVEPFYRRRKRPIQANVDSCCHSYLSFPGNVGLPFAGEFLAHSILGKLRRENRTAAFDLIHAHAALPCGHAAMKISRALGVPFVVSVHGLDAFSTIQVRGMAGVRCRRISEKIYSSAQAVICVSERVAEQVTAVTGANTRVIYNGVDPLLFRPRQESKFPLIILSVGNLIPIKGHALLIEAFASLASVIPDCALEIIGEGPKKRELISLAQQLGIDSRVRFLGRESRQEVAAAMQRCAVFALPSGYEGLGCVYLEAMMCGKPVIGCRGQGIEEIIEHESNGFLIMPGDKADLAEHLKKILSEEETRARVGAFARKTVLANHTISHQTRQLAELYRECTS